MSLLRRHLQYVLKKIRAGGGIKYFWWYGIEGCARAVNYFFSAEERGTDLDENGESPAIRVVRFFLFYTKGRVCEVRVYGCELGRHKKNDV